MIYYPDMMEQRIRWTEYKLEGAKQSFQYWSEKESEVREKYGASPKPSECRHIKALKAYRKQAADDIEYWQLALEKMKNKDSIYKLFS